MLLHKNNKFIYKNAATIELPNNVYLDPSPDPCLIEGIVIYSSDMRARIELNFVATEKEARAFLEEGLAVYETVECTKPMTPVSTNGIEGFTIAYATKRHSYEEYAFTLADGSELLSVCIEQKRDNLADPTQYSQLISELLAGVQIV